MRFFEGAVVPVMAAQANRRIRFGQQIFFVRAVSIVAGLAALLEQYLMHHLPLIKLLFVAAIAGPVPFGLQHALDLRPVRIMALAALARLKRGVNIGLVKADLVLCVAVHTELAAILFQQELRYPAVAEMTLLAFFLPDNRVQVFHREIFVSEFGVAVGAFFGCKFLGCRTEAVAAPVQDYAARKHYNPGRISNLCLFRHTHGISYQTVE